MDLTILVPVHRNEATIGRTLASIDRTWVEAQRPDGLHVVIVVDGIVDSSLDIIERWRVSTPIPTAVIVQTNAGIANARNVAWRAASTDWVTFLDADDELTIERLTFADGVLGLGTVYVGRQDVIVKAGLRIPGARQDRRPDMHLMTMLLEVSVLQSVGGLNESLRVSDDWDLAIRLNEHGIPIKFVDEPFVTRHIHGGNASHDEVAVSREYLRAIHEHLKRRSSSDRPPGRR